MDYKSASDEILISHLGIGIAQDPVQFTTSFFHFAFLHSLGRLRSFKIVIPSVFKVRFTLPSGPSGDTMTNDRFVR